LMPSSIDLSNPPPRPPSNGHFTPRPERKPNPRQQDTPVPHLPLKQNLWKPTPGPSGTQWLEDLFRKPYQYNEPPIPGQSPSSEPHQEFFGLWA
ncbi:hypothetical protein O181_133370, partial [Austropuccinia psidii MF-1]|nr:hypothetical protein [Austropuccinia psidii MF-1]